MKSQRGVQGEPMMMMQSRGSMENSGMKNKSRSPARKTLAPSISHRESNKTKPIQQRLKNMNDDNGNDEDDKESSK
jgi:hypothetical protein